MFKAETLSYLSMKMGPLLSDHDASSITEKVVDIPVERNTYLD